MNSTKKTSFLLHWDEIPSADLQKALQKDFQGQAEFNLVTPENGYRGPEQLAVEVSILLSPLVPLTAVLVTFLTSFLAKQRELEKEKRDRQQKAAFPVKEPWLIFKVESEKRFVSVKLSDCENSLPDVLMDKSSEDLKFITVIQK